MACFYGCCQKITVWMSYGYVTKHNMADQSILSIRWEKWVLMKLSIYRPFPVDPRPALVLHFLPIYFAPSFGNSCRGTWFRESWNKFREQPSGETCTSWSFSCVIFLCAWAVTRFTWILQWKFLNLRFCHPSGSGSPAQRRTPTETKTGIHICVFTAAMN